MFISSQTPGVYTQSIYVVEFFNTTLFVSVFCTTRLVVNLFESRLLLNSFLFIEIFYKRKCKGGHM